MDIFGDMECRMNYDDALDEAYRSIESSPQFVCDGRIWVTIEGRDNPKDLFVKNAAMMKTGGEV